MSNNSSKIILLNKGFSEDEARYFYQRLEEKPALKIIFKQLLLGHYKYALDIGCGIGLIENNLPNNTPIIIIAMDLDKKYLEFAKLNSMVPSAEFLKADARFLPFKDQAFDVIILHDVLFGVKLSKILSELSRNLKMNSDVFFDLPNSVFYRALPDLLPFPSFNTYNLNFAQELLQNSGITVMRRHVVAFSTNTRMKLRFPRNLNNLLEKAFKILPPKFHSYFSNIWFLTIFACKKAS